MRKFHLLDLCDLEDLAWTSKTSLEQADIHRVALYKGMNSESEDAKWLQTVDELVKSTRSRRKQRF